MDPEIVIAMYHPKEGKDAELLALVRQHMPALRRAELVTDRPSILCRASNGSYLEIFEWRSNEAARAAHEHPDIARLWKELEEVGEFPALASLPEIAHRFPHFDPVPAD